VERLHGHEVADPYRWLEDARAPEVAAWARSQQAATRAHLDALPHRARFRQRLERLWDHERRGAPWRRGPWWLQQRHEGLEDQPVLFVAPVTGDPTGADEVPPDDGAWRVLLDPGDLSEEGTTALVGTATTEDGRLLAYALSEAGSDWMTWRVREIATGRDLPDEVGWAKFSGAAWLPDGSGFLYGCYEPPPEGREHEAATRAHRLRLHRLGTPADLDPVVHARPDQPEWGFSPSVTHDGRWLVVHVFHGTRPTNRVHLAPLARPGHRGGSGAGEPGTAGGPGLATGAPDDGIGPVAAWLDADDAHYEVLGAVDDELIVLTDLDAPNRRVLAIDPTDARRRREVVAETRARLEEATLVGGDATDGGVGDAWLLCHHLVDATSRLDVHDARGGGVLHTLDVGAGTVRAVTGGRRDTTAHLIVESFTTPPRVLRHDLRTGVTSASFTPAVPEPPVELLTEQVRVRHDGVEVPLFLVRRSDVEPTGDVPTVLWGYGGFDIPVTPTFQPAWRAWVDAGGLLAVACLRGGGEYGRAWHEDGRLHNKQHVFDDALACADWLCREWTSPRHLGIEGRSNGGALVGACLTQRPAGFGSAVPEVGVLDLVRFHRWTIGWAWVSDYGSPDDPDALATLLAWSPYHNVREDVAYPPTLLTTADTDDRVVPAHSYKMAAALQHAQAVAAAAGIPGGDAPVLLRVDLDAGHGAGKPVGKLLDERADVLAFHAHHLGLAPPPEVRDGR
jgi:prolyl oligopeptidase